MKDGEVVQIGITESMIIPSRTAIARKWVKCFSRLVMYERFLLREDSQRYRMQIRQLEKEMTKLEFAYRLAVEWKKEHGRLG